MLLKAFSPSDFRDVSRSEAVYRLLRDAIQGGRLAPGERIREAELADALGVSRTPVREALKRLSAEGLVVAAAGRGLVVTELDRQQVLELYALREVLEGAAAAFAAHRADESDVAALWSIVDDEVVHADEPEELAELNRVFHRTLCAAGHNRYLMKSVNDLADALNLLSGTTLAMPGRAQAAHEQHLAIVSAVEQRDADRAEALARVHIRDARRLRMQMLFKHR